MATAFDKDFFRGKAAASQGTGRSGGGSMDDILKRLGSVESQGAAIAGDVREIKGILPSLATKAEMERLRADLGTRMEVIRAELGMRIEALETRLIKWLIGTVISVAAVTFSIAKFVHFDGGAAEARSVQPAVMIERPAPEERRQ